MNTNKDVYEDRIGWKLNLVFSIGWFIFQALLWLILIPLGLYNFITRKR